MHTDKVIQNLPGASGLLVFSLSEPGSLPDDMRKYTSDKTLQRMNIGVCLQTGGATGFSKFWVVAAFYGPADNGFPVKSSDHPDEPLFHGVFIFLLAAQDDPRSAISELLG